MRSIQTTKMRGRPGQVKNSRPPAFTVAPSIASVFAGGTVQFTAVDPDAGDTVTYSLISPPSGYSINSSTGLVTCGSASGTITVRATDSRSLYAQTTCAVTVGSAQWSGTSTVALGTRFQGATIDLIALGYAIAPVGTSPQFAIVSPPSGFSVTPTTGILSVGGTTTPSSYSVVISLSDGGANPVNRTFSVTVAAISAGQTTLTWTAPTTNSAGQSFDGSTFDRTLAGYRIHYGTNQSQVSVGYADWVYVAAPTTTYTFSLASGTWYFLVKAIDGNGDASTNTTTTSKVIT